MKVVQKMPSIHIPIQKLDGSMEWVWYMFLQWLSEHLEDTDLSDYFTKEETEALLNTKANVDDLSNVAFSGDYDDLSNKPTIPAAQVNSDWNANSGVAQILNKPTLALVATTGAYSDLSGTPNLATVATSGNYNDLSNKPTINNSTITITQGGVTKGTFTLNQSSDETIDVDAVMAAYHPDIFDWKWADHIINDVQWLRSDTFSWQSGSTYSEAYDHLVADIDGKSLTSETIGSTTVQFYLADDGHKICPASEESNVAAIYTATGVAWYYILDTANTRFKLPRTMFGFTGLRDTVGKYVEAGLPEIGQIQHVMFANSSQTDNNAITYNDEGRIALSSGGGYERIRTVEIGAGNNLYGNSTTVQPKATQMYLYFYIGQFTQTALENTAGINTEQFAAKADLNLSNMSANIDFVVESQEPTSQNDYTWYRKYRSGFIIQGGEIHTTGSGGLLSRTVNLPKAFSTTSYTPIPISYGTGGADIYALKVDSSTITSQTFDVLAAGGSTYVGFRWLAIGY